VTVWNPIWQVQIDGVSYTNFVLANLTFTSGRTNIYEQAQAGYVSLQLINIDQTNIEFAINNAVSISLKDSTGTFVPIFGGTIVDLGITIADVGSVGYTQNVSIVALGALSRLPKALTDGVLPKEFDGDQIYDALSDLLLNNWNEVAPTLQWNTYDPTIDWAHAENVGLGEIDRPGNYELAARTSNRTDVYSLVSALATSGLGYIYESATGAISYADSTHRGAYLVTNGYTDVTANHALASGIAIQTRAGDIRNSVTVQYGATSSSEESATDSTSISIYGQLAQIIPTTLHNSVDAQDQADFYLALRAYPLAMMQSITYELTNPELDDVDRDSLINIFMGLPLRISDLPLNMNSGSYAGFVEGWTFTAAYNQVQVTALLSPLAFSLQAMQWQDVSVLEKWNTIVPTLDWENALVVV
tara:strand:- start:297 stop:1544 length:1248 start_codon:yes stop_codon:yes gene_type:complete